MTSIKVGFVVNKINRETAKPFVEQHHYTHTLGKASLICGLFWGEYLLGVITFGQVSGRLLAQSIWEGGNQKNTFEFLRMCVLDKKWVCTYQFKIKTLCWEQLPLWGKL